MAIAPLPIRVLILAGSSEGSALARLMADDQRFAPTLSLAGRTSAPIAQPVPVRSGGFGGVEGLARWLEKENVAVVVDATHPYAVNISRNAVEACAKLGVPLGSMVRPAWMPKSGDRWIEARDATHAAAALGADPRQVFLSLGRLELAAFAGAPQHSYLARLIEPPGGIALPPDIRFRFARGPFDRAGEQHLLANEAIDIVVSKNSGGAATYAKIEAARALAIPVVMIARPHKPAGVQLTGPSVAIDWLLGPGAHIGHGVHDRGPPSPRSV